jgi:hypothetical protein
MDDPLKIVVSELLSNEYPIADTGWDEQLEALADKLNDEDTSLPLPGLFTVTLAMAGRTLVEAIRRAKVIIFIIYTVM